MSDLNAQIQPRIVGYFNWIGLQTLVKKEVGRFMNVYFQTIFAPLITLGLFFTVFSISIGGDRVVFGVPFMYFLAPGLLMMTMIQNSFANSSSSLIIAKVQGNIVDLLMPPLSATEILLGYIIGALFRSFMIGGIGIALMVVFLHLPVERPLLILIFALLGNMMMGALGIVGGLWAEKFDHLASITNFIVTPLTFLSGTFYALSALPPIWQKVALFNPFFYIIDGFRAGFIGTPEASIATGVVLLIISNIVLLSLAWWMLKTGYKTKS